jgi:LDH2 family malate/lactate/ureidoglycolate dehydrogenase
MTGRTSSGDILVQAEPLEAFAGAAFAAAGLSPEDAAFSAWCLVQTTLWGKDSHGVMRLPHYVERLRSGAVNPRPAFSLYRGGAALEVIDGDNGFGYLVGREAMLRAVALAREHNIAAVGARNSSHFGAAALYARLAVDRGMIGIAMTNTAPKVVAPGGTTSITGSNPVAIGVPTHGPFPFLLDMSLSTVAGGKLLLARERGEKIPLGWALDKQGNPTEDPGEAFAGSWLPMGGVKGLGLSFAVDILSGLITGGPFGLDMKSQYSNATQPSGTGHMMIALNVEALMSREELEGRMAAFVAGIKSAPMKDESAEMLVPGERAHRTAEERRLTGIPLAPKLHAELLSLGAGLGIPAGDLAG